MTYEYTVLEKCLVALGVLVSVGIGFAFYVICMDQLATLIGV